MSKHRLAWQVRHRTTVQAPGTRRRAGWPRRGGTHVIPYYLARTHSVLCAQVSGRTDFSKELPNVDGDVYAAVAKYDRRLIDGDHVIYAPIADRTTQMWETARQAIQHVVNGDEQVSTQHRKE